MLNPDLPAPTAINKRWLGSACLIAGAVSGLVTRVIGEFVFLACSYAAAIGLTPLYGVLSDDTIFYMLLAIAALVAGMIGSLVGSGLHSVLVGPSIDGEHWRRTFVRVGFGLWPVVALVAFHYLDDLLMLGFPYRAHVFLLWTFAGVVGAGLALWHVQRAARNQ